MEKHRTRYKPYTVWINDISPLKQKLNVRKFLEDYDVYFIDNSVNKKHKSAGQIFDQHIQKDILAIGYNHYYGMEVLMKKDSENEWKLRAAVKQYIKSIPDAKEPIITPITMADFNSLVPNAGNAMQKCSTAVLLRLMIFSACSEWRSMSYIKANLTGHCYLFPVSAAEIRKKRENGSRAPLVSLQINVMNDHDPVAEIGEQEPEIPCLLTCRVVSFIPPSDKTEDDGQEDTSSGNPKADWYVLRGDSFYKCLSDKDVQPDDLLWKRGNYKNRKSIVPFQNASADRLDKIDVLLSVFSDLKKEYGQYFDEDAFNAPCRPITVSKTEHGIGASAMGQERRQLFLEIPSVRITSAEAEKDTDEICDLTARCVTTILQDARRAAIKSEAVKKHSDPERIKCLAEEIDAIPGRIGNVPDAKFEIRLIHNKDYYKEAKLPDKHAEDYRRLVQHLTIEDVDALFTALERKGKKNKKKKKDTDEIAEESLEDSADEDGSNAKPVTEEEKLKALMPVCRKMLLELLFKRDLYDSFPPDAEKQGAHPLNTVRFSTASGPWTFLAGFYQTKDDQKKKKGQKPKAEYLLACMQLWSDGSFDIASLTEMQSRADRPKYTQTIRSAANRIGEKENDFSGFRGTHPEMAVIMPDGHTLLISKTPLQPLPDLTQYRKLLFDADHNGVKREKLRNKTVHTESGILDGREAVTILTGAMTGINWFTNPKMPGRIFYFAGGHPGDYRFTPPKEEKADSIYMIEDKSSRHYENGIPEDVLLTVMEMLMIPVIRGDGSATVVPFPAKYCREYLRFTGEYDSFYGKSEADADTTDTDSDTDENE